MKSFYILLSVPLFLSSLQAATLKCEKLDDCIRQMQKIQKVKYIMLEKIKPDLKLDPIDIEGKEDELDHVFTALLNSQGYSRISLAPKVFKIIQTRDLRYEVLPFLEYGKDEIPHSEDYVMVLFHLKEFRLANGISRSFRPFMSRYGRIISTDSGLLIIQDTGKNILRLAKLIEKIDIPFTSEKEKRWKKREELEQKIKKIKATQCKGE